MNSLLAVTVAAGALALAGCGNRNADSTATDQTAAATETMPSDSGMAPATGTPAAPPVSVDTPTYVQTAASGDMFEIQSSQLALTRSKDAAVRSFAEQMVKDHQASTAALKQAVNGVEGATIPASMTPKHADMLRALQGATGAEFDRLYVEQQRTAHAEAMDLHRAMADRADAPAGLKTFARNTLGVVEGHHGALMQMPANVAGSGMAAASPVGTGAAAAAASGQVTGAENRATDSTR